jgi:hypothetical protein
VFQAQNNIQSEFARPLKLANPFLKPLACGFRCNLKWANISVNKKNCVVLLTVDEPEKRHHCSASPKSGSCVRGTHSRQTHDIGLAYKMALNGRPAHVEQYSRHISEGPQYPRPCRWLCALRLASLRRTRACLPVRRWEAGILPQPDLAKLLQFRQDGNLSHLEQSHCNWV